MASPQPTDSHTRISNELLGAILMRDFSKRQRAILDLIIRLSYGCQRKDACIPRLSDFIVCGIDKHHIKAELKALRHKNVIGWDMSNHLYWLNKDYETWDIDGPETKCEDIMSELVKLNIRGYQKGNQKVTETVTNRLPKRQPKKPARPSRATAEGVPISILISKDKESSDLAPTTSPLNGEQKQAIDTLHQFILPKPNDAVWLLEIAKQFPNVDLAKTAWNLKMWLSEHPEELNKSRANHRSRFRTFVQGDDKRQIWRRSNPAKSTPSDEDLEEEEYLAKVVAASYERSPVRVSN